MFTRAQVTFEKDKARKDANVYIASRMKMAMDMVGQPMFNAESGKSGTNINALMQDGCVFILVHYPH
jgi:hypothetical protein